MWKDLGSYTKSEQKGVWVLMVLIILLTVLLFVPKRLGGASEFMFHFADSTALLVEETPLVEKTGHLFSFNPNEVSIKELEQLSLNARAILNWKKFQESGGTFRTTEDILKIYGVDTAFYNRIKTMVVFDVVRSSGKNEYRWSSKTASVNYPKMVDLNLLTRNQLSNFNLSAEIIDSIVRLKDIYWFRNRIDSLTLHQLTVDGLTELVTSYGTLKNKKVNEVLNIELNSADSTELALLRGIGPVLARRIVQYRQRIGGFYQADQLLEVYGLSPIVLNENRLFLTIDKSLIVPIDINVASLKSLKEHPLIGFYKAKEIIEYRKSKGKIGSLNEVYRLPSFADADTLLLSCYMSVK